MEQKKLLLVAISVGVFFVIVIGTALVFIKPAADLVSVRNSSVVSSAVPANSYYSAGRPAGTNEPLQQSGNVNESTNTTNEGLAPGSSSIEIYYEDNSVQTFIEDNSTRTLITVDPKSAAGVPDVPSTARSPAASSSSSAASSARPVSSTVPASAAPVPPASQMSASQMRTRDDYWIQTGAFTVLSRAENVKQILADKGITSIIENRNIGDTLYFRVRVGPYTTQNEADYWLALIKSINGFENSQVRLTQTVL